MSLILFLTLKSLSTMYAAFILYGLTTTCKCTIIQEYNVPDNLADDVCNEISDETQIPFECKVLSTDEIAVLPNGTLYIDRLNLLLNSTLYIDRLNLLLNSTLYIDRLNLLLNSTVYTGVGNTITVCSPKRMRGLGVELREEKAFRKPIYFSLLALMFQLQVPVVACMNRGFRGIAAPLFASFFACFLGAYYIIPVDLWLGNPTFFSPWFSGPSILCFLSLTSVAWLNLLTSEPILSYLKSIDHVSVDDNGRGDNNIVIRGYSAIIQLTLLLGFGITVFTYAVVHSGLIERYVGLPTSFRNLEKMLPFFFPPVFVLTTINVFLKIVGRFLAAKCCVVVVARGRRSSRISMHDRNRVFFNLHMFVVAYWVFGCIVVAREVMWVWNIFASLSVMMPAFIITAACLPGTMRTSRFIIKSADDSHDIKLALLTIKVDSPVKEVP